MVGSQEAKKGPQNKNFQMQGHLKTPRAGHLLTSQSTMGTHFPSKTLVLIPAFNEQENIASVIEQITVLDDDLDILVVDDGSGDRTADVARLKGAKTVRLSSNMGYGVALQTGYKYAFENGYAYLVQLDADGQHDPKYLFRLLQPLKAGEADLVLGSRFLEAKPERNPQTYSHGFTKQVGTKLFAWLTTVLVGFRVTDPTSGYKALNKQVIGFLVRDFFPDDYPDADVILICHRAGFTIKEKPVVISKRLNGKSMHRGLKPAYYVFKMLLSIFMTLLRERPPFLRNEENFRKRFPGQ